MMNSKKDFLWLNLKSLPYFRALLRAVEAKFYQKINIEPPVLDVGCGDGHFASVAFDIPLEVGIDPWARPVSEASKIGAYRHVIQGYGNRLPFPDQFFCTAISNSVLEHIDDVQAVLSEISRVLKSGSLFLFCVPNHQFLSNLSISTFFDRLGLTGIGDSYRRFFNDISRHKHCDPPDVWQRRLDLVGFEIIRWWHYFSPEALHILEWGHYFGLPSWIIHQFTGKWILSPTPSNLWLTRKVVEKYYNEPEEQIVGSYTFYIARKKA